MSKIDISRRFTAIIAITFLVACGPEPAPEPFPETTIVVGIVNDSPGFSFGTNNPAGFDVNLMRAIETVLGKPVAPTILVQRDRDQALRDKRATIVIATYSITKERNEAGIDFAGPYMVTSQALLVRADAPIINREDLKGKSVCTVAGTTGADVLIQELSNADPQETGKAGQQEVGKVGVQKETHDECVDLVQNGRADAFFTDTLVLYGYTHSRPNTFKVILPGVYGQKQFYGVGLLGGRHPACMELNKAITTFLHDKWRTHFTATLPDAAQASKTDDPITGDFESRFKPQAGDMSKLSCKL